MSHRSRVQTPQGVWPFMILVHFGWFLLGVLPRPDLEAILVGNPFLIEKRFSTKTVHFGPKLLHNDCFGTKTDPLGSKWTFSTQNGPVVQTFSSKTLNRLWRRLRRRSWIHHNLNMNYESHQASTRNVHTSNKEYGHSHEHTDEHMNKWTTCC